MATSQKISNLNEVSSPNIEHVFPIVSGRNELEFGTPGTLQQIISNQKSY